MKQYLKILSIGILVLATTLKLIAQPDPAVSVSLSPSTTQVNQNAEVRVIASNNGDVVIPANGFQVDIQWDATYATIDPTIAVNNIISGFRVTEVTSSKLVLQNNEQMGEFITGTNYTRTIAFNVRAVAITTSPGLVFNVNLTILPPVLVENDETNNDVATVNLTIEAALPVTLSDFRATKEGEVALLNWKTEMEDNSSYFEVQHSLKGKDWQKVGSVRAEGIPSEYTFTHTNPANGSNLYRLKMVDRDGTFSYSPMRSLQFDVDFTTSFAPNPVADYLKITTNTDWSNVNAIKLFTMSGTPVYSSGNAPEKEISVRNLPDGVYIVHISLKNGMTRNAKIIVAK